MDSIELKTRKKNKTNQDETQKQLEFQLGNRTMFVCWISFQSWTFLSEANMKYERDPKQSQENATARDSDSIIFFL